MDEAVSGSESRPHVVADSYQWVIESQHFDEPLRVDLFAPVQPGDDPVGLLVAIEGSAMLSAAEFLRVARLTSVFVAPPVAVVGVSVDADDLMAYLSMRTRDLTPTVWQPSEEMWPSWLIQHGTGGGPRLLAAVIEDVLPAVRSRLSIDEGAIGIAGWSLGGLFASWAWLHRPDVFSRLLAISPSLWWQDGWVLDMPAPARSSEHRAFVGVGEHEQGDINNIWPPLLQGTQSVNDDIAQIARSHALGEKARSSGAQAETVVFAGEQHLTVGPAAIARGLRFLYFPESIPNA